MILGMPVETFTLIHVAISLLGIAAGFVVAYGILVNKRLDAMTAFFLATTALANVTGFLFPNEHVTPGIVIGIISMVALTIAVAARYPFHLAGGWRGTYVISAMVALYLNCFVAVAQSFMKIPALHAMAPHGNEPPFAIAQGLLLVVFVALTIFCLRKFRDQ
jgi:hypothetical protein